MDEDLWFEIANDIAHGRGGTEGFGADFTISWNVEEGRIGHLWLRWGRYQYVHYCRVTSVITFDTTAYKLEHEVKAALARMYFTTNAIRSDRDWLEAIGLQMVERPESRRVVFRHSPSGVVMWPVVTEDSTGLFPDVDNWWNLYQPDSSTYEEIKISARHPRALQAIQLMMANDVWEMNSTRLFNGDMRVLLDRAFLDTVIQYVSLDG